MNTRAAFIAELKTELQKRRQSWPRIRQQAGLEFTYPFVDTEHQRRYEVLEDLQTFLEQMTPAEFAKVIDRIERKRTESQNQSTLF